MHGLMHGFHGREEDWGGEVGVAVGGPPWLLRSWPGMPPHAAGRHSPSEAMARKGEHKQTHPGRRRDKGQAGATSIPQSFLSFHRPKKTHAHEARLGIPKDSPLSH